MSPIPHRDLILGPHGLASTDCVCGDPKRKHQSFCGACYRTLTEDEQEALYRRIQHGYAEAYAAAVAHLKAAGRIRSDA